MPSCAYPTKTTAVFTAFLQIYAQGTKYSCISRKRRLLYSCKAAGNDTGSVPGTVAKTMYVPERKLGGNDNE
jgi:hypothetical protein